MIVVGSRGRGAFKAAFLGSVSTSLIGVARCPVLVVPPEPLPARHRRRPSPAHASSTGDCGHRVRRPARKISRQHDCVVVLFVVRSVDERQRALSCSPAQLSQLLLLSRQLGRVAAAKLLEALRVVAEPAPQLAARR